MNFPNCKCIYRFKQHYLLKFFSKDNNFFSIRYEKKCNFPIESKDMYFSEDGTISDYGCFSYIKNSKISEEEYRGNSIPGEIISYNNNALIPLLIKYADKVVAKNPEKYYFQFK